MHVFQQMFVLFFKIYLKLTIFLFWEIPSYNVCRHLKLRDSSLDHLLCLCLMELSAVCGTVNCASDDLRKSSSRTRPVFNTAVSEGQKTSTIKY